MALMMRCTKEDFTTWFKSLRPDNFTFEGLDALYDYFEQLSDDMDDDFEIDPIAICCEYTEYEDFKDFTEHYTPYANIEEIEEETTVIRIEGTDSFIIKNI